MSEPKPVSEVLEELAKDVSLSVDVREAIREGIEAPGLPLGWENIEPVT